MNKNIQTISKITVDIAARDNFEYVRAVQNDIDTRYVSVTLLDGGLPYLFSGGDIVLRGTKPDGTVIFNYCTLTENNEILVTLTPQMLAVPGRSVYEIALYAKEAGRSVLLTSFPFYLLVSETSCDGTLVESSHEFKALLDVMSNAVSINELGQKVIDASWNIKEIGKTIETDSSDARRCAQLSRADAEASGESRLAAKASETNAKTSELNAKDSETKAKQHLDRVTQLAESFPLTKHDIGLGNVDNTADSEKSVRYADSAGTAQAVAWSGISDRPEAFPPGAHSHEYSSIAGAPVFRLEDSTLYISF